MTTVPCLIGLLGDLPWNLIIASSTATATSRSNERIDFVDEGTYFCEAIATRGAGSWERWERCVVSKMEVATNISEPIP